MNTTGAAVREPSLLLEPAVHARGTVTLPGSKSISNRALLLAALAEGETELEGLLDSDDTRVMRDALRTLGLDLRQENPGRVSLAGAAEWPRKQAELFLGNAGTAFRPLTAALAVMGGDYHLSGVPRMHERPIGDLVQALRGLGCEIAYAGQEGYPPLRIGLGPLDAQRLRNRAGRSRRAITELRVAAGGVAQHLPTFVAQRLDEILGELVMDGPFQRMITVPLAAPEPVLIRPAPRPQVALLPRQRESSDVPLELHP